MSSKLPLLFCILFFITQLGDCVTTVIGLGLGLTETNPYWSDWFIPLKLLMGFLFYALYLIADKLTSGDLHTVNYLIISLIIFLLIIGSTVTVINNLVAIGNR